MFDVPGAKRIKRSDFTKNKSSSPGPSTVSSVDEDASSEWRKQEQRPSYAFEYDLIDVAQSNNRGSSIDKLHTSTQDDSCEEETFEFRLFTTARKPSADAPTRVKPTITLRASPSPSTALLSEGRFLRPNRPESHYFASSLSSVDLDELRQQYRSSAVSSADILEQATSQKWPGTALPWRIIHIPAPPSKFKPLENLKQAPVPTDIDTHALQQNQRTKPNKKRRILLRKRLDARSATKLSVVDSAVEKEKAIREKRTMLNRKNKLKRRERERRKKAEDEGKAQTEEDGEEERRDR